MPMRGRCPKCDTYNIPLDDDGTLKEHRIWNTQEEKFEDCPYQGAPA